MLELNKLLVVIDTDHEQQLALERVLQLETIKDFKLRLVSCDYSRYLLEGYYFDGVQLPQLRREYLQERKEALDALALPLIAQGLDVETSAIWGHPPYREIVHEVHRWQPDLLVHSARRHSRFSRLFLSNEDWQLVRNCPCPLLLVKEKTWASKPNLIAAVDPLHGHGKPYGLDHKIISTAQQFARLLNGDVHVVHAFHTRPLSGTYPEEAATLHGQAMADLMRDFDLGDSHVTIVEQPIEEALPELESELDADVIVMGAISRTFLADAIIGNTAEKILDYLTGDVLIIKPDDYVSPVSADELSDV